MLLLLFTIGENRYGIEATQVKEVWPALPLKPVHRTPDYIAGLISSGEKIIPVLDISKLYVNEPVVNRISTRIILIKIKGLNGKEHTLGVLAEHVTDTVKIDEYAIKSISVKSEEGSLVGEEFLIEDQLIQKINVDELLQKDMYEQIFNHD